MRRECWDYLRENNGPFPEAAAIGAEDNDVIGNACDASVTSQVRPAAIRTAEA